MRGSPLTISLVLVLATAGCFGADVHIEPQLPSPTPGADTPPPNAPPVAAFTLTNQTGAQAPRHYLGDTLTADASASHDPDGAIANYTWRLLRHGFYDPDWGQRYGEQIQLAFDTPGDRTLVLQVFDDQGASQTEFVAFGVNQHRLEGGTLLLGQLPAIPAADAGPMIGARNYSLPIQPGALALSINVTFPADETTTVRLEIRAPNGTLLNRSDGVQSPLWAIAAPLPGVNGNYTAHLGLIAGVSVEFRMEFAAWYGFV